MHICVVGICYVGLVTSACFAELGINVTCVDKDDAKIELLEQGEVPFYEPGLRELARKNISEGRLSFTTSAGSAIRQSLVILIAVGTPAATDGSADLKYIRDVAVTIGQNINGYKVIVTKSTVPVGTGQMIAEIVQKERNSDFAFDVVSNPEFLREGSAIEDFMRPNRVIIGAESDQAIEKIGWDLGYDFEIVKAVMRVNKRQRGHMVDKIKQTMGGVGGKVVAILGLTFKPNTDDMREAPSISIIQALQEQGAQIRVFDPGGMEEAKKILKSVYYAQDAYEAAHDAHWLVIITKWNQFRNLSWKRMAELLREPVVVDLRNIYEPERMRDLGFRYSCVGRMSVS